jgi:hypothetical protein
MTVLPGVDLSRQTMWRVGVKKPLEEPLDDVPDEPPELDVVPPRPSRMRRQSLSVSQPRKRQTLFTQE